MAIYSTNKYLVKPTSAPRLPAAPEQYAQQYGDQLTNVLRLYFNQIDNVTGSVLDTLGGRFVSSPSGSFYDTTTQTAAANTATVITFNSTDSTVTNGISVVSNSRLTVTYPGVYNVAFSIQGSNSASSADNMTVWFRINGVDVANTAGISAIPAKHGSINGALVFGWSQPLALNAADYVEIYWATDGGTSSIAYYAAGVTPTHPASPSVAAVLTFVSSFTS